MQLLPQKVLAAATAGALAALGAWVVLDQRSGVGAPTVELIDNTREYSELLRERAAEAPPPAPTLPDDSYPPPLVREQITKAKARQLYGALRKPGLVRFQRDAHLWALRNLSFEYSFEEHPAGGWELHTNGMGLLKDTEVLEDPPDVRVLVTGDSHTAGLVPNSESYANVLEELLRAEDSTRSFEVLNAGVGGTTMYHYLGVLEFLRDRLHPQVLIVGLYGGNDFSGAMQLYNFYHRRDPPRFGPHGGPQIKGLPARGAVGQVLSQVAFFLDNPDDRQLAREIIDTLTVEIARQCRESGISLVFVYIPNATAVQPELYDSFLIEPLAKLDITREQVREASDFGQQWLAFLEQRGLTHLDMRAAFESSQEPCFWFADLHINTHGHRLIAEALAPIVAGLGE